MAERAGSKFKLPEWATKIPFWAFTSIVTAGLSVYVDTQDLKRASEFSQKTDDRHDSDIAQLKADLRKSNESNEEKTRKGMDKLDQIIVMLEQRKKK